MSLMKVTTGLTNTYESVAEIIDDRIDLLEQRISLMNTDNVNLTNRIDELYSRMSTLDIIVDRIVSFINYLQS